jgi:hypothetical protein
LVLVLLVLGLHLLQIALLQEAELLQVELGLREVALVIDERHAAIEHHVLGELVVALHFSLGVSGLLHLVQSLLMTEHGVEVLALDLVESGAPVVLVATHAHGSLQCLVHQLGRNLTASEIESLIEGERREVSLHLVRAFVAQFELGLHLVLVGCGMVFELVRLVEVL